MISYLRPIDKAFRHFGIQRVVPLLCTLGAARDRVVSYRLQEAFIHARPDRVKDPRVNRSTTTACLIKCAASGNPERAKHLHHIRTGISLISVCALD